MKQIIQKVKEKYTRGYSDFFIIYELIDPLYDFVRNIVGESIVLLNQSRVLMRNKRKVEGLEKYEEFKKKWNEFKEMSDELKEFIPSNRNLLIVQDLIMKSTERNLLSKIPVEPKRYLYENDLNESDIDWIIGKVKENWLKYTQVYSSTRLSYLLKMSSK